LNKYNKCPSLGIFFLTTVFNVIVFTIILPSQNIFASGITIYSPYWMSNEKEIKSPYFRYCEIFGSCLNSDIRIFPFFPLTFQVQDDVDNNIDTRNTLDNNIDTRNTLDNNMGTKNTLSSIIPFELPFP
jgi:hypothetical protein